MNSAFQFAHSAIIAWDRKPEKVADAEVDRELRQEVKQLAEKNEADCCDEEMMMMKLFEDQCYSDRLVRRLLLTSAER